MSDVLFHDLCVETSALIKNCVSKIVLIETKKKKNAHTYMYMAFARAINFAYTSLCVCLCVSMQHMYMCCITCWNAIRNV